MRNLMLQAGFLLVVCSMSGGDLDSLTLEGRELHASLRTPPLDSFRDLPPGLVPPTNPQQSADDQFVYAIARSSSLGRLGPDGIRSALYARYVAGERDIGIYGLEMNSEGEADRREKALREIWTHNARRNLARVHRRGLVLVVVWHSGVSKECWDAVNSGIVERISAV